MKRLTILLDHDDLTCLEANCPQALSGTVLAFDVDLHALLLDRGINHLTPWDVVQPDERQCVHDFYVQIWDFWQACSQAEFNGIDCFNLATYRHVCCLKRLAWVAYALRRCLDELRPREVVTFEERTGHGLDQPPGYHKMPLLFALARGLAEQAGIVVRLVRPKDTPGRCGFVDQIAGAGAQAYERIEPTDVLAGRPFVLFAGSGPDLLKQLPIVAAFREDELTPVQLYKSADEQSRPALQQSGHLLWHESQVTDEIDLTQFDAWASQARQAFELRRRTAPQTLRCIFANPHMDIHFDFMFGPYLRRMAWHVTAWTALFRKLRPRALVANYAAPIVDIAAHFGIPTLVLPHALMFLGYRDFPLALPEQAIIGALSELHAEKLTEWGIPPARIRITGDPAFNGRFPHVHRPGPCFTHPTVWKTALEPVNASPESTHRQRARRRRILLLTSKLGSPAASPDLPETDWADATRCFETIGRLAARRGDWEFTVKCHPRYDHPLLYEHVNRSLPADRCLRVVADQQLDDLVRDCDVVICVNVKSSAIFEASVSYRPVYLLHQSMIWLDRRAWELDRWPQVARVEQLESELDAIFTDPGLYSARVEQTCRALQSCFGTDPVPAVTRCVEVIQELAAAPVKGGTLK